MRVGDLVIADSWMPKVGGKIGIIVFIQDVDHCTSARVLFGPETVFMRLDNLRQAA